MIIDKNTHIQDFKLFEEQDGHLIPVQYTTEDGGEWKDWSKFVEGTDVHGLLLSDGSTWHQITGLDKKADEAIAVVDSTPSAATPTDLTAPTKAAKQKRLAAARKKTQ